MTTDLSAPQNPMPELAPSLKQRRLSRIQDSIERRNRGAIEHTMTYPEVLTIIIQAVRKGIDVVFNIQTQTLQRINAARATGSYERKMQTLSRVPLLMTSALNR